MEEVKGIKHFIDITTNTYYITIDDVIVMSIDLSKENNQIIIKTPKEVYAGPVDFIEFSK